MSAPHGMLLVRPDHKYPESAREPGEPRRLRGLRDLRKLPVQRRLRAAVCAERDGHHVRAAVLRSSLGQHERAAQLARAACPTGSWVDIFRSVDCARTRNPRDLGVLDFGSADEADALFSSRVPPYQRLARMMTAVVRLARLHRARGERVLALREAQRRARCAPVERVLEMLLGARVALGTDDVLITDDGPAGECETIYVSQDVYTYCSEPHAPDVLFRRVLTQIADIRRIRQSARPLGIAG